MFNLGFLFANGQGVAQDYSKAREWYEKATANDNASAMVNLARLYDKDCAESRRGGGRPASSFCWLGPWRSVFGNTTASMRV